MKKFIVTYHAPTSVMEQMANTPKEDREKGMEQWMIWAQKCGNHLIDMGRPLAAGERIFVGGKSKPSNREVCGYSILQAENVDQAKKLLDGHPHLNGWDKACEIELHEALDLQG
jgi:hypothetical protein